MADLSTPSFIPKQNPVKNTRRVASRQVYILNLVSYLLLISALIAVVALFAYDRYTQTALANEIESLNKEISDFNVEDMESLVDLNEQLTAAQNLLDKNLSLRAVLAIVEDATIDTIQFKTLKFTRVSDGDIKLDATVDTDSFDSVLFQREVYEKAEKLKSVELEGVKIMLASSVEGAESTENSVSFSALFTLGPGEVLYAPSSGTTRTASPAPVVATTSLPTSSSTKPATASSTTP